MKKIIYIILSLTLITSCKQELCREISQDKYSAIHFDIDWSLSNINSEKISNVSIYAYPQDGGTPFVKVSGDLSSADMNLPDGTYSMLVFNDIIDDIAGLTFSVIESFDKIAASITPQDSDNIPYYDAPNDEILAAPHGQIAAWRMVNFVVTAEMVNCPYCRKIHTKEVVVDVDPTPITTQCEIKVQVENLNNAQIIKGILKGFAPGVYLESQDRLSDSNTVDIYNINFNNRTFDSSENINGTVKSTLTTFGKSPNPENRYELILNIILRDGDLVTFIRDVTDQVVAQDNINIYINLDMPDNMITLPEYKGTSFGVDKWGDGESVELL